MVSVWSIAAMFFTMLIPLAVFVVILIRFLVHYKTGIKPVLIGAGVFLVFVLVLEQVLHLFVLKLIPTTATFFKNPLPYAIYGALAAGVFEETGRLVGFKLFFKKAHSWKDGVAYGIGHGGLEVICIGGVLALTQINNIIYSIMINNGTFGQMQKLVQSMPTQAAAIDNARQQLISLPSWEFFVGGLERIDAFIIQLALSVIILYAVANHRYWFFALGILLHAIVDFTGPILKIAGMSALLIEVIITAFAVAALIFLIISRRFFKEDTPSNLIDNQ
jgi:uncharacterized membrane protein YhfC